LGEGNRNIDAEKSPSNDSEKISIAAKDVLIHPTNLNTVYVTFRRKGKGDQQNAGIYKTDEAKHR
jgi:hypothetical protein